VDPDELGYVFSYDDESTVVWVLKDKVAAEAIDNHRFPKKAKGKLDQLKIIHETFSIPRQVVSYRADLPSQLVARIKEKCLCTLLR
jgi:phosphonate transport system substrate-binding protein